MKTKAIPSCPGYRAGDDGRVYGPQSPNGIAGYMGAGAYRTMTIVLRTPTGHRRISKRVHVLIAEAWHGPRPDGLEVDHIDSDKMNNRPSNLAYVTPGDNSRKRASCKLRGDLLCRVRELYATGAYSQRALAALFNVSQQGICYALRHNLGTP